jgi:LysR family transcriptional regulator for bpeEF and oprC
MDRFRTMQLFAQVAELGSFRKAADRMGLPASTVSTVIQSLERDLGVRLLQRTTRRVSLTEEGMTYLDACTRVLADLEDVDALFARVRHSPRGIVRVDLPERLARLVIIPALPGFFELYPDIQLRLAARGQLANLVGEGIDCAVRVGQLNDSSLGARQIASLEQINCAAPAYVSRLGAPQHPDELQRHVTVNYFSDRTGRDLPWEFLENGRLVTVRTRAAVSVTSSEAYVAACLAGLGLAQLPRSTIAGYLARGELVEVMPNHRAAPLPVSVIYAHHRTLAPRVRAFVDWVGSLLTANASHDQPVERPPAERD